MKARLINLWDHMVGSYWFIPSTIITVSLMASFTLPWLDQRYAHNLNALAPWPALGPGSARVILSTIAGVMTTVISLVFSLTILTLSIATSQFGPRLLRSFLNIRPTQVALGTFVATAVYALIVLGTIRGEDGAGFVPRVSVYVAIGAAIVNLIYLIFFVQTIAELIQAPNVVLRVARDLDDSIARLCPVGRAKNAAATEEESCDTLPPPRASICATQEGYIQGFDAESLARIAKEAGGVIRMHCRPGQFLHLGGELAAFHGDSGDLAGVAQRVNQCVVTGSRRTPRQDLECALLELVELAVRALSSGVNDPFTAVNCIDRLGAALGRIAQREMPPCIFRDEAGEVRVVTPAISFGDLVGSGLDQIRQQGRDNPAVLIRIVESLGEVAKHTRTDEARDEVLRQVAMVEREGESAISEANDRDDLRERADHVRALLEDPTS